MNYRMIDLDTYYRKGIFRHFSEDCKCSVSITKRIDVTALIDYSKRTDTKFYINFLYTLSKALNSREDYRLSWLWQSNELIAFDQINPTQYIFHEDTETFTLAYTEYDPDHRVFYKRASEDIRRAKETREYGLDAANHPNWFDASFLPWLSYDALHIELPDGYLYFNPIVNWGRYEIHDGSAQMPLTIRLNHAAADGYLLCQAFLAVESAIRELCEG